MSATYDQARGFKVLAHHEWKPMESWAIPEWRCARCGLARVQVPEGWRSPKGKYRYFNPAGQPCPKNPTARRPADSAWTVWRGRCEFPLWITERGRP